MLWKMMLTDKRTCSIMRLKSWHCDLHTNKRILVDWRRGTNRGPWWLLCCRLCLYETIHTSFRMKNSSRPLTWDSLCSTVCRFQNNHSASGRKKKMWETWVWCSRKFNAWTELNFIPYPQSSTQWPLGRCHTFQVTAVTRCRENETDLAWIICRTV